MNIAVTSGNGSVVLDLTGSNVPHEIYASYAFLNQSNVVNPQIDLGDYENPVEFFNSTTKPGIVIRNVSTEVEIFTGVTHLPWSDQCTLVYDEVQTKPEEEWGTTANPSPVHYEECLTSYSSSPLGLGSSDDEYCITHLIVPVVCMTAYAWSFERTGNDVSICNYERREEGQICLQFNNRYSGSSIPGYNGEAMATVHTTRPAHDTSCGWTWTSSPPESTCTKQAKGWMWMEPDNDPECVPATTKAKTTFPTIFEDGNKATAYSDCE